jgi:hypothetical protein
MQVLVLHQAKQARGKWSARYVAHPLYAGARSTNCCRRESGLLI